MNLVYQQIKKLDINYPVGFTIIRVVLGFTLTIRGIFFLINMAPLQEAIVNSSINALNFSMALALIIMWVHMLGGALIILGLKTRIAVWAQIPIVLGAIIFINTRSGLVFTTHSDLLFSVFILLLLVLFAFEGGGKISMDAYLKKHEL
jgi:putative oxidoreductase